MQVTHTVGDYNAGFFNDMADGSYRSAQLILPFVNELCHPKSVIDIGCGPGTWLKAWQELGITDITGIDGDYARPQLVIDPAHFTPHDLTQSVALDRRYDLAMSLEVAEHLPDSAAATFIDTLCRAAPIVLFSAALPEQGGQNHVNEQPLEYWAGLFAQYGYQPLDVIRPQVWTTTGVEWWYAQNAILFCDATAFATLSAQALPLANSARSTVHPAVYKLRMDYIRELEVRVERMEQQFIAMRDQVAVIAKQFMGTNGQ